MKILSSICRQHRVVSRRETHIAFTLQMRRDNSLIQSLMPSQVFTA